MAKIAVKGNPRFRVSDIEIRRGGVSYTIDTAREFHRKFPKARLFLVVGADSLSQLGQWKEIEALARLVTFLVAPRPEQKKRSKPIKTVPVSYIRSPLVGISSTEICARTRR